MGETKLTFDFHPFLYVFIIVFENMFVVIVKNPLVFIFKDVFVINLLEVFRFFVFHVKVILHKSLRIDHTFLVSKK